MTLRLLAILLALLSALPVASAQHEEDAEAVTDPDGDEGYDDDGADDDADDADDADVDDGGEEAGGDEAAGEARLPLSLTQRPLVLPPLTLRLVGDLAFRERPNQFTPSGEVSQSPLITFFGAAAVGIIEHLEVGATLLPILVSPDFRYGNPFLYGRYQFVSGTLELGAELAVSFPVAATNTAFVERQSVAGTPPALFPADRSRFELIAGVPAALFLGDSAKLDIAFLVHVRTSDPVLTVFEVPVGLDVNLDPNVYIGLRSGVELAIDDLFGETHVEDQDFLFPFGIVAGYTLARDDGGPMLDVGVRAVWWRLVTPLDPGGDRINLDNYVIGLTGSFYTDL